MGNVCAMYPSLDIEHAYELQVWWVHLMIIG